MHHEYTVFGKNDALLGIIEPADDWLLSDVILAHAINNIHQRVKVNTDYDIPYLAGYSVDGKTVYIDRDVPECITIENRLLSTYRFLILHEAVEKALIDQLQLRYQDAHQIALRIEKAAIEANGISWRAYDNYMQHLISSTANKFITSVPIDLDLKPYYDEGDVEIINALSKYTLAVNLEKI